MITRFSFSVEFKLLALSEKCFFPKLIMLVESTTEGCYTQILPQLMWAELWPSKQIMLFWYISAISFLMYTHIFPFCETFPTRLFVSTVTNCLKTWSATILFKDFTYKVYCTEKTFTFVKIFHEWRSKSSSGRRNIQMSSAPFTKVE